MLRQTAVLLIACLGATGCAATRPVLYPNPHYQSVGKEAADQDIAACMAMAEAAGTNGQGGPGGSAATATVTGAAVGAASGAVGGAIVGAAGRGAAIGAATGATAGLIHALIANPQRSPAFERFVDQCLEERGYQPLGWN